MVKKLQKMANKKAASPVAGFNPAALLDNPMAQNVRDQAQQIWAAGLGAFNKAQGEGGKVFETLVKEGMSLQKKTQNLAETKFGAVATKMTGMAGDVGSKAGQQWDKLESIFEERVSRALKSLGVPSGADIGSLISRIDALSAAIGFAPAKKRAAAKKAAAKPVAKPVAKSAAKPAAKPVAKKAPAAPKPAAAAKTVKAVKAAVAQVEKAAAPAKKAVAKKAAAVKTTVAAKSAAPVKAVKAATADAKVAVKRAPRQVKAAAAPVVETAKEAVQA